MSRLFSGTPFDRPIICPTCGKAAADCRCLALPEKKKMSEKSGSGRQGKNQLDSGLVLTPHNSKLPPDQLARIRAEKRKGNRIVTIITGLDHPANDLPALCTILKQALGVGGSVQGSTIELQGDQGEAAVEHLTQKGIRARRT